MPWSAVSANQVSATGIVTGTTGITVALAQNAVVHHILVAGVTSTAQTVAHTFSDTQGNTWTTSATFNATDPGDGIAVGWTVVKSSAADTIKVVAATGSSTEFDLFVGEFIPPGTVSADGSVTTAQNTTGSNIITPAGGGTHSGDLVVNVLAFGNNWSSWGGSWVSMGPAQNGNAAGYLLNASGSATPNANQGASSSWGSIVLALQSTVAAGSAPWPLLIVPQAVKRSTVW